METEEKEVYIEPTLEKREQLVEVTGLPAPVSEAK